MAENVLLITVDSLRYDYISKFGHDKITTPYIDKLADNASVFHNAYAHIGATRMSFPTILASSTPLMYGGYERISSDQTLISEVFHDEGYATAGFHSNLYLSANFGYNRGFDTFFDSQEGSNLATRFRQFVTSNMEETMLYPLLKKMHSIVESTGGINIGSYIVSADSITDKAIDWSKNQDSRKNFLWIHYMDPHHPYLPPKEIRSKFCDNPPSDKEALKLRRKALDSPEELGSNELNVLKQLYEGEIYFTDREIKRLVESIKDEWDETLVVLTADHGEQFNEHGSFRGEPLYEEMTHVPLIIHNLNGEDEYNSLVGLTDVAPTILQFMDIDIPDSYVGDSLLNLVKNEKWDRDSVIGGYIPKGDPIFTYRDYGWRYISRSNGNDELYDIDTDPHEQKNVKNEYPDVASSIKNTLHRHRKQINLDDLYEVDMQPEIKDRLQKLGYQE